MNFGEIASEVKGLYYLLIVPKPWEPERMEDFSVYSRILNTCVTHVK